jgi:cysteine sulfinate desulfinase/cysteine desulfurase-like protein
MRAGTESVVLLSGFGKAAEMLEKEGDELFHHLRTVRNYLRESLERALPEVRYPPSCSTSPFYHQFPPFCPADLIDPDIFVSVGAAPVQWANG